MLLPNLVTVLAICAGLSGIRLAFEHRFETAVVMVLVAAFLDGIDGRLARMLKATSRFGAQMDSLADIVNFGVAPALVMYAFLLDQAGSPGWIATLLYTIACALRLARFNVLDEDEARPAWQAEYFVGVPAPAGAVIVMLPLFLMFTGSILPDRLTALISCGYVILVAFLLISRLPVHSGKKFGITIKRDTAIPLIFGVVFYVLMLATYTWPTLALSAMAYLAFLPLSARAYARRAGLETRSAASSAARHDEP